MDEFAAKFENVDILFSSGQDRAAKARMASALTELDAGRTREEIIESCGIVLGAADVNLTVERGEIFVLMGLSGSGKTTVLRAVNGLNRITRGRILIRHGEETVDMSDPPAPVLRKLRNRAVSMVFQQFALLPWRTVRHNVELGLELRGMSGTEMKETVDKWLDLVGLLPWADKHARELSGGMQQRVGLARALVTNPDILLMDEPFSALDPLIRNKLQDELLALQREVQKTIIFVTHDLDEALKIGNRIAIMKDGRVVQVGPPQDIVLRPENEYVAEFVRHMNPLTAIHAASMMRPVESIRREDGTHRFTDDRTRYELDLDEAGRLTGLRSDGTPVQWRNVDAEMPGEVDCVSVVDTSYLLKGVVELRKLTGCPVLVSNGERIIGCCGANEILEALTQSGRQQLQETVAAG